jgi:hypothetical protein
MVPSKCVRTVIVVVPFAQKQQRKRVDDEWERALRLRQALPLLQHMQHAIEVPRVQRIGLAKERAKYDGNEFQDHLFFVTRSAPGTLRSGLAKWLKNSFHVRGIKCGLTKKIISAIHPI